MASKKKKRKQLVGKKSQLIGTVAFILAIVFMPTTILLFLGMLPTIVAGVIDRTGRGTKALTVGAMNLAGCTPFLLELWTSGHSADVSLEIITDPRTIIVIYALAGVGYIIDWAMVGIVSTLMVQRGEGRMDDIKKRQAYLVERWGREVTGDLPLDAYGFPVESDLVDISDETEEAQDVQGEAQEKAQESG